MSELKHTLYLGLLVLIFGLLVGVPLCAARASTDKANWDNLKQLVSGQEIQIVLNDAKSFQGKFQSVSDEALVIRLATGEQTFNRQSVLRVSSKGQSHRLRNAAIGAAIGAGVGLGIGAAVDRGDKCNPTTSFCLNILPNAGKEIFTPLGGLLGAGVGALMPTGGWRDVYCAR